MSCLFAALGKQLGIPTHQLRQQVCDYLARTVHVQGIPCDDIFGQGGQSEYVSHMRSASTWGGGVEIGAVCAMFRAEVEVRSLRPQDRDRTVRFHPPGLKLRTLKLTWTGGHYEVDR